MIKSVGLNRVLCTVFIGGLEKRAEESYGDTKGG